MNEHSEHLAPTESGSRDHHKSPVARSDTPRTDANAGRAYEWTGDSEVVSAQFARDLERLWRNADAAREKAEESLLAIQASVRTPKADERLQRLQRRAEHLRGRPPLTPGGMHRDKAELSALEWVIARNAQLESALAAASGKAQDSTGAK